MIWVGGFTSVFGFDWMILGLWVVKGGFGCLYQCVFGGTGGWDYLRVLRVLISLV